MTRRNRTSADDLTPDEIAALRSGRTPEVLKEFLSRRHDSLGVTTSAYRKVTAAARAEYEALMAVATLQAARIKVGIIDVKEVDQALTSRLAELERENRELVLAARDAQERAITAGAQGAMAVSGER